MAVWDMLVDQVQVQEQVRRKGCRGILRLRVVSESGHDGTFLSRVICYSLGDGARVFHSGGAMVQGRGLWLVCGCMRRGSGGVYGSGVVRDCHDVTVAWVLYPGHHHALNDRKYWMLLLHPFQD